MDPRKNIGPTSWGSKLTNKQWYGRQTKRPDTGLEVTYINMETHGHVWIQHSFMKSFGAQLSCRGVRHIITVCFSVWVGVQGKGELRRWKLVRERMPLWILILQAVSLLLEVWKHFIYIPSSFMGKGCAVMTPNTDAHTGTTTLDSVAVYACPRDFFVCSLPDLISLRIDAFLWCLPH